MRCTRAGINAAWAVAACLLATTLRSQTQPEMQAFRAESVPTIDGDVLGDPAWANIPPASDFRQTAPVEGAPASERTEVRVSYSADTLYVGVVCFDADPARIVVSGSRRDGDLDASDSIRFILDTFRDGQNGFVFGTNPAALEYDAQVSRGGQGGGGLGAGAGLNPNWDGAWEVHTQTGDFGWSAEFAIPFRTLRFGRREDQIWGVNFQRNIRRRNETAYWAPLSRELNLYRVDRAGTLAGLELKAPGNLKLTPYVLGEGSQDYEASAARHDDGQLGADLKYSLTGSLTLDVSVNTDFAQVEVDEQQINLDRFNLFFPEKRPFFLENAGNFAVGESQEVELFFSRRIGIGPEGEVIPILAGGRLSGRAGGFNIGFLDMQTREQDGVAPANNFAVLRVQRELPNRSAFGGIFVNRQATGDAAGEDDHNRTYGVDGRWGIGKHVLLEGFAALTETPDEDRDETAFQLGAEWNSPKWELFAKYAEVGEGFNPEVGFLSRPDGYRKPSALVFRRIRPESFLGLQEIRPHVSYTGYWKPDGFQESGFVHVDSHWEWKSGYELHTAVNFRREGVREPFEIYPGVVVPPGSYDETELQLVGYTDRAAPFGLDGRLTVGGFFGGDRVAFTATARGRTGETFNAEVRWQRNDVDLPGGAFVTNLVQTRVNYSFSPRLFVEALLQYNDRIDNWSTNVRLGWLQTANTGLFVVFTENRDTGELTDLGVRDRSIVIKFSRMFDLLN